MKNRTFAKLNAGEPVYGFASGIGSSLATETLAASGIDFVILAGQHGSFGMDRVIDCLLAIGAYPAAAVASAQAWMPLIWLRLMRQLGMRT